MSDFLSEIFHFLMVKFSVYLNRRVFVMCVVRHGLFIFLSVSMADYMILTHSGYLLYCFLHIKSSSEKGSTLKGNNLLTRT